MALPNGARHVPWLARGSVSRAGHMRQLVHVEIICPASPSVAFGSALTVIKRIQQEWRSFGLCAGTESDASRNEACMSGSETE